MKPHFLYWIRLPEHTDILTEGYVGITYDVGIRYKQHLSNAKHTHRYSSKMRTALLSGQAVVSTILIGSVAYCRGIEGILRPVVYVGWNKAIGGDGGIRLTHGLTGKLVAKTYYNLRTRAMGESKRFEWESLELFVPFYEAHFDTTTEFTLNDVLGDYTSSNVVKMTRKQILARALGRKYVVEDVSYNLTELGMMAGVIPNTILTRLRRGWPLMEAIYGR